MVFFPRLSIFPRDAMNTYQYRRSLFRHPPPGYPAQTTPDPGPWPPVTVDLGRRPTKILTSEGAPLAFFPPFLQYKIK